VFTFIAVVAPLLGLAFAFDAVNGERAEGTLHASCRNRSTATT
jgi:ABC-type transport system involved in multi-copper enzyme maturation permease subunit